MSLLERRRAMMVQQPRLPINYQEVEYIENSGSQYIVTNSKAQDVDTVEVKAAITSFTARDTYLCGVRYASNKAIGYALFFSSSHGGVWYYPMGWSGSGIMPNLNEVFTTKAIFNSDGTDKFYYNGVLKKQHSYDVSLYNTILNIGIGCLVSYSGLREYISYARYYEVKFSKNGNPVAHFIPCYRKSDNVAGMYDIITNTFFRNAGFNSFIVGPDVNN